MFYKGVSHTTFTAKRAKELRQEQTYAEKVLWQKLRAHRFHDFKFRRQVPVGPYIVDFLCNEARLIIEIDGDTHWEPGAQEHDSKRDEFLASQGFCIARLKNREILKSLETVMHQIGKILHVYDEHPSP
jgi:very-short-patch-repair endonuclease